MTDCLPGCRRRKVGPPPNLSSQTEEKTGGFTSSRQATGLARYEKTDLVGKLYGFYNSSMLALAVIVFSIIHYHDSKDLSCIIKHYSRSKA